MIIITFLLLIISITHNNNKNYDVTNTLNNRVTKTQKLVVMQ
jgi:hypothetical protein